MYIIKNGTELEEQNATRRWPIFQLGSSRPDYSFLVKEIVNYVNKKLNKGK
jgi:hypothetical protein